MRIGDNNMNLAVSENEEMETAQTMQAILDRGQACSLYQSGCGRENSNQVASGEKCGSEVRLFAFFF